MLDRTIAPPIKDAVNFNLSLLPYQFFQLNNGVPVYTIHAGPEEVLSLQCIFYAGNWVEGQTLVAASTNYLLKSGTEKNSSFGLNNQFEFYGASLELTANAEFSSIKFQCLNKHIDFLLPVLREVLTEAVFPQQELEIFVQNQKQMLDVNLKKSSFVANRLIDASLYGAGHPYGKYSTHAAYDALTRESLNDFFVEHYKNGQWVVFAAGKIPVGLDGKLNAALGDLGYCKKQYENIAFKPAAEKKWRVENDALGVQGSIRMARHFPNRRHEDFIKCQVLNTLFGGFFSSRLMDNIREDKGYTYGIHSYLHNHIFEGAWAISTEAGKDVCEATITEVYKEMEGLKNDLVDKEELLLVKNYLIGNILGDLDGPFHIIRRWKSIILQGLGDDYFSKAVEIIKHITAEELQALAQKYLNAEEFYELVVV